MPAGLKFQSIVITTLTLAVVLLSACSRDNPLSIPGEYIDDPEAFCIENGPYFNYILLDSIDITNVIDVLPENYPEGYEDVTLKLDSPFLLDKSKITPVVRSDYKDVLNSETEEIENLWVVLQKSIDDEVVEALSPEEVAEIDAYDPQITTLSVTVQYQQNMEELTEQINDDVKFVTTELIRGQNIVKTKVNAKIKVPRTFKDCKNPLTTDEISDNNFEEDNRYKLVDISQTFEVEISRNTISSFAISEKEITSPALLSENDQVGRVLSVNDNFLVLGSSSEDSSGQGVISAADFQVNFNQNENAQNSGAVYIFQKTDINTWSFHSFIKSSNSEAGDLFGTDVAISNSNTLMISAPGEDSNASGIHLNSNIQTANKKINNTSESSGAVYLFSFDDETGIWSETHYIKPQLNVISDGKFDKGFGTQIAIHQNKMLISAPLEDSDNGSFSNSDYPDSGAVYSYKYSSIDNEWSFVRTLKAFNPSSNDKFGSAIAMSDDFIAIGAPFEDHESRSVKNRVDLLDEDALNLLDTDTRFNSGAVYIFNYSQANDVIDLRTYIKSSNSDSLDYFGSSVAISSSKLLVGATGENSSGKGLNRDMDKNDLIDSGAAYLFHYNQENQLWTENAFIKANDSQENSSFGQRLVMEDNNIFISAPLFDTDNHIDAGKIYFYTFDQNNQNEMIQDLAFQRVGLASGLLAGSELAIYGRNLIIGKRGYVDGQSGVDIPFVGTVTTYE